MLALFVKVSSPAFKRLVVRWMHPSPRAFAVPLVIDIRRKALISGLNLQGSEFAADCLDSIPMTPVGWWIARRLRKLGSKAALARVGVGLQLNSVYVEGEGMRIMIAKKQPHSSAWKEYVDLLLLRCDTSCVHVLVHSCPF